MDKIILEDSSCPICGNTDGEEIVSCEHGVVVECECGLMYANKRIEMSRLIELQELYMPSAFFSQEPHPFARRFREAHEDLSFLEKHCDVGGLFDVCAGSGAFAKCANERGWDVAGNDLSVMCCVLARHVFNVNILRNDLTSLRFEPGGADAVTLINALEHLRDPVKELGMLRDVLTDDGKVLIRVPMMTKERVVERHQLPQHIYNFDRETLGVLLDVCGFRIIDERLDGGSIVVVGEKND